jgi:hypothetical protein
MSLLWGFLNSVTGNTPEPPAAAAPAQEQPKSHNIEMGDVEYTTYDSDEDYVPIDGDSDPELAGGAIAANQQPDEESDGDTAYDSDNADSDTLYAEDNDAVALMHDGRPVSKKNRALVTYNLGLSLRNFQVAKFAVANLRRVVCTRACLSVASIGLCKRRNRLGIGLHYAAEGPNLIYTDDVFVLFLLHGVSLLGVDKVLVHTDNPVLTELKRVPEMIKVLKYQRNNDLLESSYYAIDLVNFALWVHVIHSSKDWRSAFHSLGPIGMAYDIPGFMQLAHTELHAMFDQRDSSAEPGECNEYIAGAHRFGHDKIKPRAKFPGRLLVSSENHVIQQMQNIRDFAEQFDTPVLVDSTPYRVVKTRIFCLGYLLTVKQSLPIVDYTTHSEEPLPVVALEDAEDAAKPTTAQVFAASSTQPTIASVSHPEIRAKFKHQPEEEDNPNDSL